MTVLPKPFAANQIVRR